MTTDDTAKSLVDPTLLAKIEAQAINRDTPERERPLDADVSIPPTDAKPVDSQAPPETDAPAWLSNDLVARATALGFSRDDAEAYGSADLLERTLDRLVQFRIGQAQAQPPQPAQPPAQPPAQQPPVYPWQAAAQPPATPAAPWQAQPPVPSQAPGQPPAPIFQVDESLRDDPLAQQMEKFGSWAFQQINALSAQLDQTRAIEAQREANQFVEWFDGRVSSTEEMADVFGSGPISALPRGGPQVTARAKLMQAYQGVRAGFSGQMSDEQMFAEALRIAFPNELQAARRAKQGNGTQRNGRFATPPSRGSGRDETMDSLLERRMAEISQRTGVPVR